MLDGRTASSFRLRLVAERSVRRLCKALKRPEEASETSRIRLVTASRPQEFQALTLSSPVMQRAIKTMTDLINEDTVNRSSMTSPKAIPSTKPKKGRFLDSETAVVGVKALLL